MKQRVITAVVALIFFIPVIYFGGIALELTAIALGLIAMSEIFIMRHRLLTSPEGLAGGLAVLSLVVPDAYLSFLPEHLTRMSLFYIFVALLLIITVLSRNLFTYDDAAVITLSAIYIGIGFNYLVGAREAGLSTLIFILFVVWATDIGAYMFGRQFGKHKLAPAISPNKTLEGSLGGILSALVVAAIYLQFFPLRYDLLPMIGITLVLSISGQLGDLIESALKRFYGVKDSGKILPGHGGILDRFDSLLFVLPIAFLFGLF